LLLHCNYNAFFAVKNIRSLYHVRISAHLLAILHGPIEALATLVLHLWSPKENLILMLGAVALIIPLLLPIPLRLTRTYRKGYHCL